MSDNESVTPQEVARVLRELADAAGRCATYEETVYVLDISADSVAELLRRLKAGPRRQLSEALMHLERAQRGRKS